MRNILIAEDSKEIVDLIKLYLEADDYVVKPFNPLELSARVSAQLRRFYSLGASSDTNYN